MNPHTKWKMTYLWWSANEVRFDLTSLLLHQEVPKVQCLMLCASIYWPCLLLPRPLRIFIVFRFIIEYSSLRDFYRPLGNNNNNRSIFLLLYEDFWKIIIFWLVLKLRISYFRVMIFWRILVSFKGFFNEDYIFAWWNIWIFIILPLPKDTCSSIY
jgi:hypothetical protein